MRRFVLLVLTAVLAALIAARSTLPEPAAETMAAVSWEPAGYNILDLDLPVPSQTAGSALTAEMNSHFLSRAPTAKHSYTGLLAGRNLILLLAENWQPERLSAADTPALYRLWREGIQFAEVYAPDWYQGPDGKEFALLTGLTPTTVNNGTAMALLAGGDTALPFALGTCLGQAGYTCRVYSGPPGREAAYEALGFSPAASGVLPEDELRDLSQTGPFCAYQVLPDQDGEAALERLWQALEAAELTDSTAVCLAAGGETLRGSLFLWARDLAGITVPAPCSELDVTPTLLDLFGADYDSRFLSGRDLLADGTAEGPSPPVALYGSAYSDWVADAGSYVAAREAFYPAEGRTESPDQEISYVLWARQRIYDQYIFSRRILEVDYFRQIARR